MRFSTAILALSSAAVASAANLQVLVGDANGLTFTPSSVTAASGDTINFEFRSKNHSVTQSTFANPCQRQTTPSTGVDSGFQPVAAGATEFPAWSITIDDPSAPLWFFCAQTQPANHCKTGMVFAVNAPPDKTFQTYQDNAKASTPDSTPPAGGNSSSSGLPPVGGASTTGLPTGSSTGGSIPLPTTSGFSVAPTLPQASSTNTDSSAAPSGTDASANGNGAPRIGGSATTLLVVVGLVAGLVL